MKIKGIRHIGFVTSNMTEMIRFYKDFLGLELYWDKIEQPEHTGYKYPIRTVKLKAEDGTIIELLDKCPHGNHFALTVSGIKTNPMVWIKDPDGNEIEVVSNE